MRFGLRCVTAGAAVLVAWLGACGSSAGGSGGSGGGGAGAGSTGEGGGAGTGGVGSGGTGGAVFGGALATGGAVALPGGGGSLMGGTSSAAGGTAGAGSSSSCAPDYACKPKSPNTGDIYADCVARVNQFRACVCLPPLPRWSAGESCADQNASYDAGKNSAHAGFQAGICAAGNAQDECPAWGGSAEKVIDGCLQMMFDEGPPPTTTCTGTCYSEHGHFINMTGAKYKSGVACGFYTTSSGSIWAVQNFQ